MPLLLIIFALADAWIYICFSYYSNMITNVKAPVNKTFGFSTTLSIPYIYLYNHYIQFEWSFDDLRLKSKDYVIENIYGLDDQFHNI